MKRRSSIFKKYFYVLFLFAFFISTPAHAGFWGNLWNFLISPIAKPIQLIFGIDIRTNNNNTTTRSSNPNSNIDTQTNEYDSKEEDSILDDSNNRNKKKVNTTKEAAPPIPDDKKDKNNGLKKDNFRNQEIEIDRLLCKKESKENLKVRPPSKNGTTVKEKPIKLREQKKTQVRFLSFAKELKQRKPTTKVAVKKPLLNEVTITNIRKTLDRLYRLHAHSKHNKEAQLTNAKREWSTFITEQTKIYNNNFVKNPISDQQFAELYIKQSRIEKEERERIRWLSLENLACCLNFTVGIWRRLYLLPISFR